jgi:outer membrane protein assembly factor BamE (lipoprotein component of BamABCDE complex)
VAQNLDPDNEKLAAAIAEAEAFRYMTKERLATVKKNMTQKEVRALLGTPKVQNVREFDQGVIGWFYPKEEPNTASAVFFRERKGVLKVYKTDFEAVKSQDAGS